MLGNLLALKKYFLFLIEEGKIKDLKFHCYQEFFEEVSPIIVVRLCAHCIYV